MANQANHKPSVALLFDSFGPYHLARTRGAMAECDLRPIGFGAQSSAHTWTIDHDAMRPVQVLYPDGPSAGISTPDFRTRLGAALDECQPQAVAVPGWAGRLSFAAMQLCLSRKIPVVVMSESSYRDLPRGAAKEAIKRRYVGLCSAALVGGPRQAEYATKLGVTADRVFLGYDAVDNDYFQQQAAERRDRLPALRESLGLPKPFFLTSCRFILKKNLARLVDAYAQYRDGAGQSAWDLVVLGDGVLRPELESQRQRLRLERSVHLPGYKQYGDLPDYYALASAFVLASISEQWGLVVNEAMASGLPVLVSEAAGCSPVLVAPGENGWTFDPFDTDEIAACLTRMAAASAEEREAMGDKSREIIADWGPTRFATGLRAAAEKAIEIGPQRAGLLDRVLLESLIRVG